MLKKIDRYTLQSFAGTFIVVFGVLFFLFLISFVLQKIEMVLGKGLDAVTIMKFIFYLGISIIRMVLPLAILLGTIMTFGDLGEHYELAAIKSTGTSLWRTMRALFIFSILMGITSFIITDYVSTDAFRKVHNMNEAIKSTQASAIIEPGVFMQMSKDMPPIRVGQKKGDSIFNIYVFDQKSTLDDQRIIFAKKGTLVNHKKLPIVVLKLYDGHLYQDNFKNLSLDKLKKQPASKVKYDSLIIRFDIKQLLNQDVNKNEDDKYDNYNTLTSAQLQKTVDSIKKEFKEADENFSKMTYTQITGSQLDVDSTKKYQSKTEPKLTYKENKKSLDLKAQIATLESAKQNFQALSEQSYNNRADVQNNNDRIIRVFKMEQYNRFVYAFECIVMFLIAAPLGAIIRKGGMGMPLVIGIAIFIIFFLLENSGRNMGMKGYVPPGVGACLPILVLFPLSIYLTIKANNDSEVFNQDRYFEPIRKLYRKIRPEKVHKRYQ